MKQRTFPKLVFVMVFVLAVVGALKLEGTLLKSCAVGLLCGLLATFVEFLVRWPKFKDWMRFVIWILLSLTGVGLLVIICQVEVKFSVLIQTIPYALLYAICRFSSWKKFPHIRAKVKKPFMRE